ncbi:MAG: RNA polymerase sigma factor [Chitinophagaceae bacterium]|nr:RNA polymerase sigma factor [Chitinophagaceae bacterium]
MIDELHFENLYNGYKKLVYNMCLHYVLNAEDAQDITQEVFVKVHQRYSQYDPKAASEKTWICRIAINHCLDFIKSKKTKKRFGFISSLFHQDSDEQVIDALEINHPGVEAEHKEALTKLLQIIYALPENQKTAIILSKIEDRPQKEVAEIMNTSVKAVESLLQRAKQTIHKNLTNTEGL